MRPYRNILLALDLDPNDDEPLAERAAAIAEHHDAKLNLVHAMDYVSDFYFMQAPSAPIEWEESVKKTAWESMESFGEKFSVPVSQLYLRLGPVHRTILDVAEEVGADLIIVGSHSKHGLSLMLMGSTSNEVINQAHCDILVVRV